MTYDARCAKAQGATRVVEGPRSKNMNRREDASESSSTANTTETPATWSG
jgi:hypothetical protein